MAIERYQTDEMFDKIKNTIGAEKLAEEMNRAMSVDQAYDILTYIARAYDID